MQVEALKQQLAAALDKAGTAKVRADSFVPQCTSISPPAAFGPQSFALSGMDQTRGSLIRSAPNGISHRLRSPY
jgi:hypothetical protein